MSRLEITAISHEEAVEKYCPMYNQHCVGVQCMAWLVLTANNKQGVCGMLPFVHSNDKE